MNYIHGRGARSLLTGEVTKREPHGAKAYTGEKKKKKGRKDQGQQRDDDKRPTFAWERIPCSLLCTGEDRLEQFYAGEGRISRLVLLPVGCSRFLACLQTCRIGWFT